MKKQKQPACKLLGLWVKKSSVYQTPLVLLFAALFIFVSSVSAACREGIMISEIYGGGGNSGSLYKNDFIELYNSTLTDVIIDGWSVQYASSSSENFSITTLNGTIKAGKYYLIGEKNGSGGTENLPSPFVQGNIAMSASAGKIALVDNAEKVFNKSDGNIVDFVGYGNTSEFEGNFATSPGDNIHSIARKSSTCLDSNDNKKDFNVQDVTPGGDNEKLVPICEDSIILSEVSPFDEEFVEVENISTKKCDLAGWKIGDEKKAPYIFPFNSIVESGKYMALSHDFGLNGDTSDSAQLFNPTDTNPIEIISYEKPENNKSYSRDETGKWGWTTKTPNDKNVFEDKTVINENYAAGISISEIFPAPVKDSGLEEFVELYSASDKLENLDGWFLKDKVGKTCFLDGSKIDPAASRFLILKNDADKKCSLELNDTQGEFLGLFNPGSIEPVSSVSYEGSAKKGRSYNFDGSTWHWSQFLTQGAKNIFNKEPYGKMKNDKDVFVGVYADFSVSIGDGDGDAVKVVWDFGDGHKSYLANTRHKYLATGTYSASVKLSDGSEDVLQNFLVNVKKFPHPKVSIVAVNANPTGSDSELETITIENRSKKKINLEGWSIATGWKKLANHPIAEKLTLKKKEAKVLGREFSRFTLNNKKGKIELRYPDGEVASKIKYDHGKISIEEGEVYQKTKGGWEWVGAKQETITKKQGTNNIQNTTGNVQDSVISSQEASDNQEEIIIPVNVKRENKLLSAEDSFVKIELLRSQPRVLGAETVREVDGIHFFTPQDIKREHYVAVFFKNSLYAFNSRLNRLLNYFFN